MSLERGNPMTREQQLQLIYRHTHRDYKGRVSGVPSILVLRGSTMLFPLSDLTDEEIASRLPYAQHQEAKRTERAA